MSTNFISWFWTPTFFILLGGLISLFGTIWAAKEQADSEKSSRQRAEDTLAYLVGSHSFEFKHQFSKIDSDEVITIFIKNIASTPSYGVTARIIDIDSYGAEEIRDMADLLKKPSAIYEKHWDDIAPGALSQALSLKITPGNAKLNLKVFISSRKGVSSQKIRFQKADTGQWKVAE